jgi:hypothetical protein
LQTAMREVRKYHSKVNLQKVIRTKPKLMGFFD